MIIKASTSLCNDYGAISELAHKEKAPIHLTKNGDGGLVVMSIEVFERREELFKFRVNLEVADRSRVSSEAIYSLEESRSRLEAIYGQKEV